MQRAHDCEDSLKLGGIASGRSGGWSSPGLTLPPWGLCGLGSLVAPDSDDDPSGEREENEIIDVECAF